MDHSPREIDMGPALAAASLSTAILAVLLIPFFTLALHELVFRDVVLIALAALASIVTGAISLWRAGSMGQRGSTAARLGLVIGSMILALALFFHFFLVSYLM